LAIPRMPAMLSSSSRPRRPSWSRDASGIPRRRSRVPPVDACG
jgi:hypothetical protein